MTAIVSEKGSIFNKEQTNKQTQMKGAVTIYEKQ